jgi:hypothetical protein
VAATLGALFLPGAAVAANCQRNPDHPDCRGGPPLPAAGAYVLYLDEYITGGYYLAALPDLQSDQPAPISPRRVTLKNFRGRLGNPDVSADGRRIVFAGLLRNEWGVYAGKLDVIRSEVTDIVALANRRGIREEDPRFSWDGQQVVYKCAGDICLHPERAPGPVVVSACELWGPSFHPAGTRLAYAARCGAPESDRIHVYDLATGQTQVVANADGGPDRFPHFRGDGALIYSHLDPAAGEASLWRYAGGQTTLFHDRTVSDDDPYADKTDWEYLAFVGYQERYNLFIFRESRRDSVRISQSVSVLGPVIFHTGP